MMKKTKFRWKESNAEGYTNEAETVFDLLTIADHSGCVKAQEQEWQL